MSGHSKWSTIKHAKGVADQKRSKLFSKLSRDITIATKLSGNDESPIVRVAIEKAKAANMTKDKITAAINKGLGIGDNSEALHENTYEAYSPQGIAILIDTETDSPNRTLTEIKTIVQKNGGKMLSAGSISWMFQEVGRITLSNSNISNTDDVMLQILDYSGIVDVRLVDDTIEIITEKESLYQVQQKFTQDFPDINLEGIEIVKRPKLENIDNSDIDVSEFLTLIEEQDDVISTWTNKA